MNWSCFGVGAVFGAQPQMKPTWTLGGIDKLGQPQKPVYSIGKVIEKGEDYRKGMNLPDYVNDMGHFDLIRFLLHAKPNCWLCMLWFSAKFPSHFYRGGLQVALQ